MSVSNNATNGNFLKATTSMPALTGDWTVACWAALTQQGGVSTFVSIEDAGPTNFIQFFANPATRQPVFSSVGGGTVNFPGGLFTNAAWVFYAASHVAGGTNTTTLYRGANGGALSTTSFADTTSFTPTSINLFNEAANDEPTNGNVLGFMLWTAALSAKEIGSQYFQLHACSRVNALERWVPIVDSSHTGDAYIGRSRALTLTGALTASHSMPSVPWNPPMLL